ncbi:hypothetical protein RI367_001840 [Sorochytrium milnesiophthora]
MSLLTRLRPVLVQQHLRLTAVRCLATNAKLASATSSAQRPVDELIKIDHRSIFELYDRFLKTEGRVDEQQKIANELIREVAVHSAAEETTVYSAIQKSLSNGKSIADHLRSDHQEVKELLYDLDKQSVGDADYKPKLEKIIKNLRQHTKIEEEEELVKLRQATSAEEMITLGKKFEGIKAMVPTRPHPSAPDQPTLEAIVGMMTAPIDKARDMTREFAERKVSK